MPRGKDGLFEILPQCQQIVVVLPLTSETRGIVNKETLAALPEGAFITNIGRGGHVIDEDLLAALDSGHIAGAFLDVFNQEPLPVDHSYWNHPKVIMTPVMVRSCRAPPVYRRQHQTLSPRRTARWYRRHRTRVLSHAGRNVFAPYRSN